MRFAVRRVTAVSTTSSQGSFSPRWRSRRNKSASDRTQTVIIMFVSPVVDAHRRSSGNVARALTVRSSSCEGTRASQLHEIGHRDCTWATSQRNVRWPEASRRLS